MKKFWWILIVVVVAVGGFFGIRFWRSRAAAADSTAATGYQASAVTRGNLQIVIEGSGNISSAKTYSLTPSASGQVSAVLVQSGDWVQAGQVLVRLDTADATARLKQAVETAGLAAKRLAAAKQSAQDELAQAQSTLKQAQNSYDTAKSDYARTQKLYDAKAATRQELENAVAKVDTAADTVASAQSKLKSIQLSEEEAISSAEVSLASAQDSVASTRKSLSGMVLAAPQDGLVTAVDTKVGAYAGEDTALVTLSDQSKLTVETEIDENDIAQVQPGQKASISVQALSDSEFDGTVLSIGGSGHSSNGVVYFTVKIALDGTNKSIKPGMTADASIIVSESQNALHVPNGAIETRMGRTVARMYVSGKEVSYRRVTTGLRTETSTEILSGLKEGEKVAIRAGATGSTASSSSSSSSSQGNDGGPPDGGMMFLGR